MRINASHPFEVLAFDFGNIWGIRFPYYDKDRFMKIRKHDQEAWAKMWEFYYWLRRREILFRKFDLKTST